MAEIYSAVDNQRNHKLPRRGLALSGFYSGRHGQIGAVILSSVISTGANFATDSAQENSFVDDLGDSAAQQAATIGSQIVDRQLDVQPTITFRPGFKLIIMVNKDMILEPCKGA